MSTPASPDFPEAPETQESQKSRTERTRVRRVPERGIYDPKIVFEILGAGYMCHVGFNGIMAP
jgi:hypothetical protein